VVERLLAKEKVTGSNPVARSFSRMAGGSWLGKTAKIHQPIYIKAT
jgi:hypothetical protein